MSACEVSALSLGRVTVQSALGEPLRAEVDVPDINSDEAASVRATVAAPSAYTAAGMEYNQALSSLQATLVRRPDGRAFLRLSTDRVINDPFVDLILEARWSSGRIVRDYTMLFDPPAPRPSAAAPTMAQTGSVAPARAVTAPSTSSARAPAPAAKPAMPAAPVQTKTEQAKPPANDTHQLSVAPGDTAGKIARQIKSADVSLDQMLVALMRANPDAFTKGNLNRLRAGAVLELPTPEQAKAIPAAEASQTVLAQSKDFNEFRRNLAENAPKTAVDTPKRNVSGAVQARVEERKSANPTPDKLTLSKGALQAKNDEAKIAQERSAADANARAAEIAKNISELNKLQAAAASQAAASAAAAAAASKMPAVTLASPAAEVASAAPAAVVASAPVLPVSAPVKAKPVEAAPAPAAEPGMLETLLQDQTLVLGGGAALLALVGGFFFFRRRQTSSQASQIDSSFLESRLPNDSFFGASGGQRVDTSHEQPSNAASLVYAASQLDGADDVDPVAEADVYLAYGRDLQAEEILKEALRHNPGRLAIHTKMLEIFAKRRDAASFQNGANQALVLAGVDSPEWAHICELGLGLDPKNPLYHLEGAENSSFNDLAAQSAAGPRSSMRAQLAAAADGDTAANVDLDLDIDFSDEDEATAGDSQPASTPHSSFGASPNLTVGNPDYNALDFDISMPAALAVRPRPSAHGNLDYQADMGDLETVSRSAPLQADFGHTGESFAATPGDSRLQFEMGSLSLDLDIPLDAGNSVNSAANSLDTKLALAEEFISIGDHDGARALIEEVMADASGPVREKARQALAQLH